MLCHRIRVTFPQVYVIFNLVKYTWLTKIRRGERLILA